MFLLILLFNFYGYRLVIASLKQDTVAAIETKADRQEYSDDELVSVKTVLNLPYYTSSKDFERAYGSININGIDYEYVKRRVHNDTLELLCLPNAGKTKLKATENELAKGASEGSTLPNKKSTSLKISLPDFCHSLTAFTPSATIEIQSLPPSFNTAFCTADHSLQQERPPQSV